MKRPFVISGRVLFTLETAPAEDGSHRWAVLNSSGEVLKDYASGLPDEATALAAAKNCAAELLDEKRAELAAP